MRIGILQTGHTHADIAAVSGTYPEMFERLLKPHGFDFQTWDVTAMAFPTSPNSADGWLITGSPHGAYEDHPWIDPLERLVREIYKARRPLVGICFGHQIIAQALGGRVEKWREGWSVGRTEYRFRDGATLSCYAWHQDQVTLAPPGAEVLAEAPGCEIAALAVGDRVLTVQPHPEFDPTVFEGLIAHRGSVLPPERLAAAKAAAAGPVDQAAFAARLAAVLKGGSARSGRADVA
ncbi:MAG: type 1 glutamine amidotransferase [Pseudomonadota bacterium]